MKEREKDKERKRDRKTKKVRKKERYCASQVWWFIPIIPAPRRRSENDHEFETSLDYIVKPCLKNQTKTQKKC
jgi:hypothetical protein